jgi:hypothetical protein
VFSMRQLYWIPNPSSPFGFPTSPERRVLGVRSPNSKKIAEPYPRQRCDKGRPISPSRNVCKALALSLLTLGSPVSISLLFQLQPTLRQWPRLTGVNTLWWDVSFRLRELR